MQQLNDCQRHMINNPIHKEIGYDELLDIRYTCKNRDADNRLTVCLFVDKENSPMHEECIGEVVHQMCKNCEFIAKCG